MDKSITDRDILIRLLDKADEVAIKVEANTQNTKALTEQVEIANGRTSKNEKHINDLRTDHTKVKTIFGTLSVLLTGAWAVITFILK